MGGSFLDAGGNPSADYIAQWDGSTWSALGNGLNNTVNAIAVSGSNIYIAGNFLNAGGDANADYIAKLDGGTWAALGATPLTGPSQHRCQLLDQRSTQGATFECRREYQHRQNRPMGWIDMVGPGHWPGATVVAIALSGEDVYAGGLFTDAGGNPSADKIAKWDGTSWSALGGGLSSFVNTIAVSGSNVYVGGNFLNAGGDAERRLHHPLGRQPLVGPGHDTVEQHRQCDPRQRAGHVCGRDIYRCGQ